MSNILVYFIVAAGVSFVCSVLEAVILSVTPSYIAVAKKQGTNGARILEQLYTRINRPLAAILSLNTIANTLGAAGVGAQVHKILGSEYVAIVSGVLTFTILIFSEIIPKTIGASRWKMLAPVCTYIIYGLIFLMYPFVYLSEKMTGALSQRRTRRVTREEMIESVDIGVTEGALRHKESLIIKNLLKLDNIFVTDIMTPRSVVWAYERMQTVGEVTNGKTSIRYSRIPVYNKDLDHIDGMVHRYRILEESSRDHHDTRMVDIMAPIATVHEELSVASVLDEFIKQNQHLFLVLDDYGTTVGIVTLEDAIETLLGVEIIDEYDAVADLRKFALEQWKKRRQLKVQAISE